MSDAGSSDSSSSASRMASLAIVLAGISVVAVGLWWFVLSSPEERSARADVAALSSAVADYVLDEGTLPRVTVTPGRSGGDVTWGPDFVVEERTVPRADPETARVFFVVGGVDRWCVEALYTPPTLFSDSSGRWVHAEGRRGEIGRTVDGRCGEDFVLVLSAVTETDGPDAGSTIGAATAPVGTCIAHPFAGDAPARVVSVEVVACDDGHFGEIFYAGEGTGNDFADYEEAAANSCAEALMPFVGVHRNLSALNAEPFTLDMAAWDSGARQFSCLLFLPTEDYPLVGSARDSWR